MMAELHIGSHWLTPTPDYSKLLKPADSYLFRSLRSRFNTEKILEYIEKNPCFLENFAAEINIGVTRLNNKLIFDQKLCPNAAILVEILNKYNRRIPNFEELFDPNNLLAKYAVDIAAGWMKKGEEKATEQPYINWHTKPKALSMPVESLTAGVIMDIYGIYAAITQHPQGTNLSDHNSEKILKNGKEDVYFGSELIMPAVEESLALALSEMKITDSAVLQAIQPWLGRRYGFSIPILELIRSNFEIALHPQALEPINDQNK